MWAAVIAVAVIALYAVARPFIGTDVTFFDFMLLRSEHDFVSAPKFSDKSIPTKSNTPDPVIQAQAAGVYDITSGFKLWAQGSEEPRPIASITKLMTALVFLDHNPGWQTIASVERSDYREGGKIHLFPGDRLTVRQLFTTALSASDNVAIVALARLTGLPENQFVQAMNDKATRLRLRGTTFVDPTGLSNANRSTPGNIAKLAQAALAQPDIRRALSYSKYEFVTEDGRPKIVEATNRLLEDGSFRDILMIGGKTGHLDEAGYCFVGQFSQHNHDIVTVILGAPSDEARFSETKKLLDWAYKAYEWKK